eukprot:jgi/Psemu1/293451/fgenesh1_pg.2402_\
MPQKKGCSLCRCLSSMLTLAMIGGGGYAAWYFLGQPNADELVDYAKGLGDKIKDIDFGDFTDVLQNFTGFTPEMWNEDPFVGDNTTNVWTGHTKGEGGLTLELWNALDETWQSEYVEAVSDWNTLCKPKVLVLTNKDVELDRECTQADGVMKVCNGNYGETGWLGITRSSNPIWETAWTTPTTPPTTATGDANCDRLLEMYGEVDEISVRRRLTRAQSRSRSRRALRYRSDAELYEDEVAADANGDADTDDAQYYYEYAREEYPNLSDEYESAMKELYYELEQGSMQTENEIENENEIEDASIDVREERRDRQKWRLLREHPRGGDFVRRLNDGFELEVHVLYARE